MKILVTGANGFLGISLHHSLKENRVEGHTIDMPPPLAGIHHNKSLADAIGLRNFLTTIERDCIVHPAGVAINPDIQTYYAVNTGLAANLIWGLMEWGNLNCPVILQVHRRNTDIYLMNNYPIQRTYPPNLMIITVSENLCKH